MMKQLTIDTATKKASHYRLATLSASMLLGLASLASAQGQAYARDLIATSNTIVDSIFMPSQHGWRLSSTAKDLPSCLAYAKAHSSQIHRSKADLQASQARYRRAIGRLLPSLSISTDAYYNFGRGLDAATNTYTDVNSFRNNYNANLNWTLFDGLSQWRDLNAASAERKAAKLGQRDAESEAMLGCLEAYYDLHYAYYQQELAKEKASESKELMERIRKMEALGMKSLPELYESEALYYEEEERALAAANAYELALLNLGKAMNWPIDEPLQVRLLDEQELMFQEPDAAKVAEQEFNSQHPKVLFAEERARAAKLKAQSSWGAFMPTLTLIAGYSTGFSRFIDGSAYENFADQLKHRRGSYIGLNLSIPVFTGFRASSQRAEAKAQAYRARIEFEESIQMLHVEQRKIEAELKVAPARHRQVLKRLEAAELAYKAAERRYEEGLISLLELTQLQNRKYEAHTAKLRSLLSQELNLSKLEYYYMQGGH